MPSKKLRGMTTIEALLVAAAFIIVGVIGVMVFQGMGKSMSEALRANAIVTADKAGFDVTIEVLNGKLTGLFMRYAASGQSPGNPISGTCYPPNNPTTTVSSGQLGTLNNNQGVLAGQSITCRFNAGLQAGAQYTYIILAVDGNTGKEVQIAKGVITVGIS
ncbi:MULTISPECIES: hypothetical protein [Pyrobaculum]|uniref:Uncharacterized protein n=2 Tax=Pyrobaculum arsenaticum TaxID=121277 RepID=A4WKW1_PYRAR|nr:hypothetical protein [Pyrobaculum arsenaticum]ABP51028.1 conserved hypothetical protein [Pyrobaculum arsenaticum DSM 13514]MCY0891737.1 hypothetical protein [Pyrobaculum arsenaticum]NYR15247.1 hypothetical protein [Pyrobaculum arsenaticum]